MPACTPMVNRFETLTDLRSSIHLTYTLPEILFIVYASILSGYNEWEGMANFAHFHLSWFRQFFPYRWRMPSHHTIEKVCMMIDPKVFMQLFVDWMHDVVEQINAQKGDDEKITDDVIALDDKALRGSRPAKGKKMVHIVSAYSTKLSLILGFTPVEKKSNEITAIPEVLDMLVIEGCLITSNAMGCQKAICQKIRNPQQTIRPLRKRKYKTVVGRSIGAAGCLVVMPSLLLSIRTVSGPSSPRLP